MSEIVGVRRETVTKWHKNPFFSAELNVRREELWVDAKLRLKSLAHEAVNVLTKWPPSADEKVAITAAVHILKTVGLYGEVKQGFGPDTPEETVWDQATEKKLQDLHGTQAGFILRVVCEESDGGASPGRYCRNDEVLV